MTRNTKLARAVAMAMTGTALSLGAVSTANAAVTTMYNLTTSGGADNSANTTNPTGPNGTGPWALKGNTDGWLYGFGGSNPAPGTGTTSVAKWAGTTGTNTTPFNYTGAHLNWAMEITGGNGGTGTISTFDAFAKYGTYADVDAAQGAWADNASGGAAGWRHDLDFGLFRSDTSGLVTLNVTGVINAGNDDYGFTIFKGQNTNASYGHHGGWNADNNTQVGAPNAASLPGGGTTLGVGDIVAYSIGGATPSNIGSIQFNATAGQVYTIVLGGFKTGSWGSTIDGYQLTVSQVPVPAAVWLFGSALAGMGIIGRRKEKATA